MTHLRSRPVRQTRRLERSFLLVQIHPLSFQVVEVAAQSETRTSPLERLRLGRRPRIIVISPLFSQPSVYPEAVDRHLAGDHNLGRDSALRRSSLLAFEVLDQLHGVIPRPAGRSEQLVQTVRVRTRIGVCQHLPPESRPVSAANLGCVRHPPLDLGSVKWLFERGHDVPQFLLREYRGSADCPRLTVRRWQRNRGRSIHNGTLLHRVLLLSVL